MGAANAMPIQGIAKHLTKNINRRRAQFGRVSVSFVSWFKNWRFLDGMTLRETQRYIIL
jgi:hypothetical protein